MSDFTPTIVPGPVRRFFTFRFDEEYARQLTDVLCRTSGRRRASGSERLQEDVLMERLAWHEAGRIVHGRTTDLKPVGEHERNVQQPHGFNEALESASVVA